MQNNNTIKSINKDSNERLRKNAKYYDEVFSKFDEDNIIEEQNNINMRNNYNNIVNNNNNNITNSFNSNSNNSSYNRLRQNVQFEEDIPTISLHNKKKKNLKWDMTPLDLIIYVFILVMFIFSVIMMISSR